MSYIYVGTIKDLHQNIEKEFRVYKGINPTLALKIQTEWGQANIDLITALQMQATSQEEFLQNVSKCMLQDAHWNWMSKCFACNDNRYEWFYLIIDNQVQAASIIYHPHESKIDKENIFYVDYLAVAPWNRNTPIATRQFESLGTILLSICAKHSNSLYLYRIGFSLHSLPQALGYYIRIGMTDFGIDHSKQSLNYLEMEENNFNTVVGNYA